MNEEHNHFNVVTEHGVLHIYHHQGLEEQRPAAPNIWGTIDAPAKFYLKRKDHIDKNKAYIEYNNRHIRLMLDEDTPYTGQRIIQGELDPSVDLNALEINREKYYSPRQMAERLKRFRFGFWSREEFDTVVWNLQNFQGKVDTEIQKLDDLRGNKTDLMVQKLSHNLKLNFELNWPIFEGGEKTRFTVEVIIDYKDSKTICSLSSIDLIDLEKQLSGQMVAEALKGFGSDLAIVRIANPEQ